MCILRTRKWNWNLNETVLPDSYLMKSHVIEFLILNIFLKSGYDTISVVSNKAWSLLDFNLDIHSWFQVNKESGEAEPVVNGISNLADKTTDFENLDLTQQVTVELETETMHEKEKEEKKCLA